ncbi:DUF1028 domain-containing protein [Oceaniglobus roseus]|uniref:DUF1028 domain-containing protein n=1 Tax=Oceaniglobus roseus TaxID=1737570 RepID=UPI000C7EC6C3|nr:DUF1028 domain-containing protein [Kandeliimicrobium roseum]
MTLSLLVRDGGTGAIGVIVVSRSFACGALVPHVGARVAVASQGLWNPVWGTEGRRRMSEGETARDLIAEFSARDAGHARRQVHMMDGKGRFAAHTGAGCLPWAGHLIASDHSVAGAVLSGPAVLEAVSDAYSTSRHLPLAERLIWAMRAGEAAGGCDLRGRQSAGLVIHRRQDHPWVDLRVDDHAQPLDELDRLWDVAQERYLACTLAMGTRDNFSGLTDRAPIEDAILRTTAERRAAGRLSRSWAVDGEA